MSGWPPVEHKNKSRREKVVTPVATVLGWIGRMVWFEGGFREFWVYGGKALARNVDHRLSGSERLS